MKQEFLFKKLTKPPTSDAAQHYIRRAHFHSLVWLEATKPNPNLSSTTTMGWELKMDQMFPVLLSLQPVPEACLELTTCGCSTRCSTRRCSFRKSKLTCTSKVNVLMSTVDHNVVKIQYVHSWDNINGKYEKHAISIWLYFLVMTVPHIVNCIEKNV